MVDVAAAEPHLRPVTQRGVHVMAEGKVWICAHFGNVSLGERLGILLRLKPLHNSPLFRFVLLIIDASNHMRVALTLILTPTLLPTTPPTTSTSTSTSSTSSTTSTTSTTSTRPSNTCHDKVMQQQQLQS